jgi:hypothetical protein
MIIGYCFEGDDNEFLWQIQCNLYGESSYHLVSTARHKYLDACHLINYSSNFSISVRNIKTFDHRVLQATHDIIAAWYRYKYADRVAQLSLPLSEPSTSPTETIEETYRKQWRKFWQKETENLTNEGPFIRAILQAVVYQNLEKGYQAEELLWNLLIERYDAIEWYKPLKHK